MKRLLATLALSLLASASAGGGGPRPAFPLAVGQVWELTYQVKGQPSQRLQRTLQREDSHHYGSEEVRNFVFSVPDVPGEGMEVWPKARYLAFGLQEPHVLCITPTNRLTAGYLLAGPMEVWEAVIPSQQSDSYNPIDVEGYAAVVKKANLGTCTLKRLR